MTIMTHATDYQAMAFLSLPQLLILFDHLLLAVLFLVALFCIVAAVTSNIQVVVVIIMVKMMMIIGFHRTLEISSTSATCKGEGRRRSGLEGMLEFKFDQKMFDHDFENHLLIF